MSNATERSANLARAHSVLIVARADLDRAIEAASVASETDYAETDYGVARDALAAAADALVVAEAAFVAAARLAAARVKP